MKFATHLLALTRSAILVATLLVSANTFAATHTITFGNDLRYTPQTLTNVQVGDVITWEGNFSMHPLRFVDVPNGAITPPDVTSGTTFSYTVEVAGNYGYICIFHQSAGMEGGFVAQEAARVDDPLSVSMLSIAPNPIQEHQSISIELGFNGSLVRDLTICDMNGSCDLYFKGADYSVDGNNVIVPNTSLPSGAYVVAISTTDGAVYRRKLIVTR